MMQAHLGDRTQFQKLRDKIYLNHASVSPISIDVEEAVRDAASQYAEFGLGAAVQLQEQRDRLRAKLAILLSTEPANLALVANTTTAIMAYCPVYDVAAWRSRIAIPGRISYEYHALAERRSTIWP